MYIMKLIEFKNRFRIVKSINDLEIGRVEIDTKLISRENNEMIDCRNQILDIQKANDIYDDLEAKHYTKHFNLESYIDINIRLHIQVYANRNKVEDFKALKLSTPIEDLFS